ncbi:hypothetical protein D3C87_1625560 [compost metagenome]
MAAMCLPASWVAASLPLLNGMYTSLLLLVWFSSRVRVWSTSLDWLPPIRSFDGSALAAS